MWWVLKKNHLDEHPKHMFKLMDKKLIAHLTGPMVHTCGPKT